MAVPVATTMAGAGSASGAEAVSRATAAAVESLGGDVGLLVAFTAGQEDSRRAAAELHEAAGGAPSVGMTGKGVFAANEPIDSGCAAVAFGQSIQCGIGVGRDAGQDFRGAGLTAAREALDRVSGEPSLLMLLVDVRAGDLADAIAGAYEAAGPEIPLAGGAASGSEPSHYANGEAVENAVVAVALRSERAIGLGNAHSCSVVGEASVVTRSDGTEISEIDGRPAEEVYIERVGGRGGRLSDEAFEAMAITHPLAQPEAHGNRRLRHILGRCGDRGLLCSTNIPAGAEVEFTVLSLNELVSSGWDSVNASLASLGNDCPKAALVFDCAGRRRVLGHGQAEEVTGITKAFGEAPPFAGLYTDGEVARIRGAMGDHNHAVVTVTFA